VLEGFSLPVVLDFSEPESFSAFEARKVVCISVVKSAGVYKLSSSICSLKKSGKGCLKFSNKYVNLKESNLTNKKKIINRKVNKVTPTNFPG